MATRTNQVVDAKAFPTTSYAVLGLLTFGEMSGYDITKVAEQSIGFFFTPAKSQIYSELRRLVSLGYSTEREVEQDRLPDKRLYRITERGRRGPRGGVGNPAVGRGRDKKTLLGEGVFCAPTNP